MGISYLLQTFHISRGCMYVCMYVIIIYIAFWVTYMATLLLIQGHMYMLHITFPYGEKTGELSGTKFIVKFVQQDALSHLLCS